MKLLDWLDGLTDEMEKEARLEFIQNFLRNRGAVGATKEEIKVVVDELEGILIHLDLLHLVMRKRLAIDLDEGNEVIYGGIPEEEKA